MGKHSSDDTMEEMGISIEDLDLNSASETPFEFEVKSPTTGKGIGAFISVYGDSAERVRKFTLKAANRRRQEDADKRKAGKEHQIVPLEETIDYFIDQACVRVATWRGFKQEPTPENIRLLMERNSRIRDQVMEASNNAANFLKV